MGTKNAAICVRLRTAISLNGANISDSQPIRNFLILKFVN